MDLKLAADHPQEASALQQALINFYKKNGSHGIKKMMPSGTSEYLAMSVLVVALTPPLYLILRDYILAYGLIWLLLFTTGFVSEKYFRIRLAQFGLFISLVISLLLRIAIIQN